MQNINKTILFVQPFPSYLLKRKITVFHIIFIYFSYTHTHTHKLFLTNCEFLLIILYRVFQKFLLRKEIYRDYQGIILKILLLIYLYQ